MPSQYFTLSCVAVKLYDEGSTIIDDASPRVEAPQSLTSVSWHRVKEAQNTFDHVATEDLQILTCVKKALVGVAPPTSS